MNRNHKWWIETTSAENTQELKDELAQSEKWTIGIFFPNETKANQYRIVILVSSIIFILKYIYRTNHNGINNIRLFLDLLLVMNKKLCVFIARFIYEFSVFITLIIISICSLWHKLLIGSILSRLIFSSKISGFRSEQTNEPSAELNSLLQSKVAERLIHKKQQEEGENCIKTKWVLIKL